MVAAGAAIERVVSRATPDRVVAAQRLDQVAGAGPLQRVVALGAGQQLAGDRLLLEAADDSIELGRDRVPADHPGQHVAGEVLGDVAEAGERLDQKMVIDRVTAARGEVLGQRQVDPEHRVDEAADLARGESPAADQALQAVDDAEQIINPFIEELAVVVGVGSATRVTGITGVAGVAAAAEPVTLRCEH